MGYSVRPFIAPRGWTPPKFVVREPVPSEAASDSDFVPHDFFLKQRERLRHLFPETTMQEAFLETLSWRVLDVLYGTCPYAAPSLKTITCIVTNREFHSVSVKAATLLSAGTADIHMSLPALTELQPRGTLERSAMESVLLPLLASAWQHSGNAPPALLQGVADVCRIVSGHAGRGWPQRAPLHASWDSPAAAPALGFFLLWVQDRASPPTPAFVPCLNAALQSRPWSLDLVPSLTAGGQSLPELWRAFQASLSIVPVYWGPGRHELAEVLAGRRVLLRSVHQPGSCLGVVTTGATASDAALVLADVDAVTPATVGAAPMAEWLLDLAPCGAPFYLLTHALSRCVLDVPEWRREEGAPLGVWDANGGANQTWELGLQAVEDSRFEGPPAKDHWRTVWVKSKHSEKVVAVGEEGRLEQREYVGEERQLWRVVVLVEE